MLSDVNSGAASGRSMKPQAFNSAMSVEESGIARVSVWTHAGIVPPAMQAYSNSDSVGNRNFLPVERESQST